MAVCGKCDDTGIYHEDQDGGSAELICDCPVGVARINAYGAEHPDSRPLDADKNIMPRRYLRICPRCKGNEYMAPAEKVCERCKMTDDLTHDLREALSEAIALLQITVYDDEGDGKRECFECIGIAGQPHDSECSVGETLQKIKDVHDKAYSN